MSDAPAVTTAFVDRDGVINRKPPGGAYVTRPEDFDLLDGSIAAIARLSRSGIRVVVVTNQQGVAKGLVAADTLDEIHADLRRAVVQAGGELTEILVCPHRAGTCDCRKPGTGMFEEARRRHPAIEFRRSVVVGDADSDMAAAAAIGARAILVTDRPPAESPPGAPVPVASLAAAADLILQETHARSD